MPHGSGHGSHGGGHHHSSHHSSGHHSGGRGPRVSRRPFRNSRRYRYYTRSGRARYIYSTSVPPRMNIAVFILTMIMFIPFLIVPIPMMKQAAKQSKPPQPLVQHFTCSGNHIEDRRNLLKETDGLKSALQDFENTTGICPLIITAYDSDWKGNFRNPEKYALDLYTQRFSDEQHFVIVYSEPEDADHSGYVDWKWGGAQGDETDPILSEDKVDKFFDTLHHELEKGGDPDSCFEKTFRDSLGYIMEISAEDKSQTLFFIVFFGIWFLVIIGGMAGTIKQFINGRRHYEEDPM